MVLTVLALLGGCSSEATAPEPCQCSSWTPDCSCLAGTRSVRLATVRVNPGDDPASVAFTLANAPGSALVVGVDVAAPAGSSIDASAVSFDLLRDGEVDQGLTDLHAGSRLRSPTPGWLGVADIVAPAPFDLVGYAVVPSNDATFVHEHWMTDVAEAIGGRRMSELCLVGSHDAATSGINPLSRWGNDWDPSLTGLNPRTAVRASRAQDLTIEQQLLLGVRYLDLRFDLGDDGAFYATHGLVGERAEWVLDDVRTFLERNPREVVILDLQDVSGPTGSDDRHLQAVSMVAGALGDKVADGAKVGPTSRLEELWAGGYQAIVTIDSPTDDVYATYPVWRRSDSLDSPWGNKQDDTQLKAFLDERLAARPMDKLFVLQGQRTPDEGMVIGWGVNPDAATVDVDCARDTLELGLCALARSTTPKVYDWLTSDWASAPVNIVMVDYVELAPLVGACLLRNQ